MEFRKENFKSDLKDAVEILVARQGLDNISPEQYFQLECIVRGDNSVHQLPTGSGKTWAGIRRVNAIFILYIDCLFNYLSQETMNKSHIHDFP